MHRSPHPRWLALAGIAASALLLGLYARGGHAWPLGFIVLLPWLLSGEPPTRATVARLAHGGILDRDQRFRFPDYAQKLDVPTG